jgi:hypothetical protein
MRGYTAAGQVGKSPAISRNKRVPMPRGLALLIVLVALIAAALYFFSTQAEEVPTQPIEVEVSAPANAS